jgi:HAD superfamily hydrolase (TIGR01549 family)
MEQENLLAAIWDFDGTIADTRERNLDVTRAILRQLGKEPDRYDILKDKDLYTRGILAHTDWRDFYTFELGITQEETEKMGKLWGECQLRSEVEQELYPGIDDVIRQADLPQGVFSINSEGAISDFLEKHGLRGYFGSVVGYEQLNGGGKPDPEGLARCIYQLGLLGNAGAVLYIGDHKTDILTAEAANRLFTQLKQPIRVESVHASYIYGNNLPEEIVPDRTAEKPSDITDILLHYKHDKYN